MDRSLLGMDALDRKRMLDMEERIRPVRAFTMLVLLAAVIVSGPWLGYWTVIPVAGFAVAFALADRVSRRLRHPEYAIFTGWLSSQVAIGVSAALTGGPESPILVLAAMPIVSLSARFPVRVVAGGVAATLLIMAAATVGADAAAFADDPTLTILAATVVVSVGVLSTALLRSELEHRDQAVVDPLTGMLNRNALDERAAEIAQQSKIAGDPVGMIAADIDHFKEINDSHGHAAGDRVLKEAASVMRKRLRAFDLAYRIGGEEFVVLLPGAGLEESTRIAEELRGAIQANDFADGHRVTMSFGVAVSPEDEPFDRDEVFLAADAALYDAKKAGRNRVHVQHPDGRIRGGGIAARVRSLAGRAGL